MATGRVCPTSTSVAGKLRFEQFGCRWFSDFEAPSPHVEAVCNRCFRTACTHPGSAMACPAGPGRARGWIEKPIAANQEEAQASWIQAAGRPAAKLSGATIVALQIPPSGELLKVVGR